MKRSNWLVAMLAGAMLVVSPALAQDAKAAKPAKPAKSILKGEYAIMAAELKLDDAQKAKLEEAVKANEAAEKAWMDGASGTKAKTVRDDLAKAKEAKDQAKLKSLGEEQKALAAEQAKLKEDGKAKVMAVLTDDQKAQWAGFAVYRSTIGKYKAANLTADQDKQIRDMATKIASVKAAPPEKGKKPLQPSQVLSKDIEEKVLTDAQKEEMKKKAAEAKKAAEDKKAAEPKKPADDKKAGKDGAKKGDAVQPK
jgi:hypothetical protein